MPFLGTEALAAGRLNRYQLRTRYDAVYPNVYVPRGPDLTPIDKAKAAWLWSGRRRGLTMAVIRVDALLQAADLKLVDVHPLLVRHRGVRGVVQLREVLDLADEGAESPQETRLRLLLTSAGMRQSQTQIEVFDYGQQVGRMIGGTSRLRGRGGPNGKSASNTTVSSTGPTPSSARRISIRTSSTPISAGGSFASAPIC